jgi:hypothetical protein
MKPSHVAATFRGLAAAVGLAAALPSLGDESAAGLEAARTTVTADLYGRAAPSGAMLLVGALRRWDESDGDSLLLRGRYVQVGAAVGSNPAYAQGGVFGEWVPLAPLQLRAQYDAFAFFGAHGALLRFPSASARFGSSEIAALSGAEERGVGHRLMATPTLRARVGPVLLRNQTDLAWYRLSGRDGWYYESEYDTLLASSDFVISNRLAALVPLWQGAGDAVLLAGPAYEATHARKADITRRRVEGVVFWSPAERLRALARPRLLAVFGVNLEDRNRKGEAFAVAGAGADFDL